MRAVLGSDDAELPIWASYTDITMNVLVVLLVFLFTQAVYATITTARLLQVKHQQKVMERSVMQALPDDMRKDVTVVEDGQLIRFRFADRVLFDSGQAVLKDTGEQILAIMGQVFGVQKGTYSWIQVEGHTDDRPIHTGRFDTNWELSSARATSVVRFLEDSSGLDPHVLSATGYSQYRPLALGDNDHDRQLNRRIEVVLLYTLQTEAGHGH